MRGVANCVASCYIMGMELETIRKVFIMFVFSFAQDHTIFKNFITAECVYGCGGDYHFTLSVNRDFTNVHMVHYYLSVNGRDFYSRYQGKDGTVATGGIFCNTYMDMTEYDSYDELFAKLQTRIDDAIHSFLTCDDDGFKLPYGDGYGGYKDFMDKYYCIYESNDDAGYHEVRMYKVCWPDRYEMFGKLVRCRAV